VAHVPARPAVPARPVLRLRRDSVLRSLAAAGDPQAFAILYERHHQALYRYCRSILGHDEDARDALQSTMTRAFAALQGERRDLEVRPWLFRVAHNEAISLLRRRRPTAELGEAAGLSTEGLAQAVEDRERLAHLRSDLGDLPDRQRTALVLRELNGLSHAEIAAVLECSPRAVKQTIFEARAALNDCAEGRAMVCGEVQRALSDGDGRVRRGRRMRAHLRSCRSCRRFDAALRRRPAELAALAPPLPAAASLGLLSQLIPWGGQASVAGAGAAAGAGGGVAASTITKAVLVVAATATVAGGGATAGRDANDPPTRPSAPPPAGEPSARPATRAGPQNTIAARTTPSAAALKQGGHAARRGRASQRAVTGATTARRRRPSQRAATGASEHRGPALAIAVRGYRRATRARPPAWAAPSPGGRRKPGTSGAARPRPAGRGVAGRGSGGHVPAAEVMRGREPPARSRAPAAAKARPGSATPRAGRPAVSAPAPAAADHGRAAQAGPAATPRGAGETGPPRIGRRSRT
jgi:RNA polymerase sigma factor (sigma-70 family)